MLSGNLNQEALIKPEETLWIKYKSCNTNLPTCIVQKLGEKYAAMMSFIPYSDENTSIEDVEGTGEYIFVLDRSGSMRGDRIDLAKKAAILFLKSLPMNSLFNIISFGTEYQALYSKPQKNSSEVVSETIKKIEKFLADMRGTNILEPLRSIFNNNPLDEYPRTIFLLTDGQVDNPDEVVSLIKKESGKCKVHGFGIGSDVDPYLIEKYAKAGRGSANFVSNP